MNPSSRWGAVPAGIAAAMIAGWPAMAMAQAADPARWQLNMGKGVTQTARMAWEAHMVALWVCVVIGVLVFAAIGYAVFAFRKSKGAVAAQFSHNTRAEIVWTVIPVIILVIMAVPATAKLIAMYDTRDAEMTIKVTGYQWMWQYEYLGEDVRFYSRLDRESDRIRQSGQRPDPATHPHYLLEVDNRLVLPVDTKVRFVITSDDVIHSWWVPALGWKQDAIPGFINEGWTLIEQPGIYRGQCAELCGKDHGFMPIVVEALPRAEFDAWLAQRKAAAAPVPATAPDAGAGDVDAGAVPDEETVPAGDTAPAAPEAADEPVQAQPVAALSRPARNAHV